MVSKITFYVFEGLYDNTNHLKYFFQKMARDGTPLSCRYGFCRAYIKDTVFRIKYMRSCSPDEWEREDGLSQLVEAGKRGWVDV